MSTRANFGTIIATSPSAAVALDARS